MRIYSILFALFAVFVVKAQGVNCEVEQFKLNFAAPGLEYERGIGGPNSLNVRLGFNFAADPVTLNPSEEYDIFPAITVQTRRYFNLLGPKRGSRSPYGNLGEYFAPTIAVLSETDRIINQSTDAGVFGYGGLVVGTQRNFSSGFNFSIDAGAAYYFGSFKGGIYPVVHISIGWIASQKRWCYF